MSAYRDGFEACPRCTIQLESAGSARACPSCRGLWVDREVVAEMIQNMLPPTALGRLELAVVQRADRLACPSCREPMDPTTIHEVELDACSKGHGVWFDPQELAAALHAVTRPGGWPLPKPPPRAVVGPVATVITTGHPIADQPDIPVIQFRLVAPNAQPAERFRQSIIKIGRLSSAHYRIEHEDVSRLHAVVEATSEHVRIIDLGSTSGTVVNGEKVNRADLFDGARIWFGSVAVDVHLDR